MGYTIRHAAADDREDVLALLPRLADFGPPGWRTREQIADGDAGLVERHFGGAPHTRLLVAASADGQIVGTLLWQQDSDYFTGSPNFHIDVVAVAAHAEGEGIGSALMRAAETHAAQAGAATISLNVFEGNERARRLYRRQGYEPETIRYIKLIPTAD